ncbi:MAG TPA: V-type ATP synthase subunit E, partial [Thiolapillus brandeum]|nr:V-type ATP synthase subunit E [Thiolapillus brandeum]
LQPRWEAFLASVGSDREIRLQERPLPSSGGVVVRSEDDRIRVDNTFEGRLERLQPQVLQVITERLFAAEVSQRGLLHE